MKIQIIRTTPEQAELLQDISRQTFYETFAEANSTSNMDLYLQHELSLERLNHELGVAGSEFWFAQSGHQVVGYLKTNTGQAQTELKDSHALEIERIYVLKDYHGQKIGQILLEKAINSARDKKCDYIWLGVWEKNIQAISFYLKNGFVDFDSHIFLVGNDPQTDIMMKLKL